MKTKYIIRRIDGNKSHTIAEEVDYGRVMVKYADLCEESPHENFRVVRSVTTEVVIAESDDLRQSRFDFSN